MTSQRAKGNSDKSDKSARGQREAQVADPQATDPQVADPQATEASAADLDAVGARRREAALAGHSGDTDTARAYLHDSASIVRCSALRALHQAGDLTVRELHDALADPEAAVRLTGLELAASRDDIAVSAVATLLEDNNHAVVEAAAWACGEKVSANHSPNCDNVAAEVVQRLARLAEHHDDLLCRESAIAALGAISDPAGLPAILAGLKDKPEVRRRAVIALAPFEGTEVEAALLQATNDRDRQVRTAAAELLNL